jgi:hypothetical protein
MLLPGYTPKYQSLQSLKAGRKQKEIGKAS